MTSIKLASLGAKVVINYFGSKEEATQAEISSAGGEAILVQGDMTKQADVANMVQKTIDSFGYEIHILVNVAGAKFAETLPMLRPYAEKGKRR
jgi:3-oxoacyl-[acyl-carrier protein] reductase